MHDASIPDHVPPALVFEFDMYRDARLANDVHLGYRSLHRDAPDVFYTPCNGGHWVVTRMQDLRAMMMDPEHFSSAVSSVPKPAAEQSLPLPPQDLDPPEHAKYRALLTPLLSRPAVNALEPLARQLAIELIDAARPHGGCEFVEQFARQMPVKLFMTMMGMDLRRYREFVGWVHAIVGVGAPEARVPAHVALTEYLTQLIHERQASPGDDPISQLLRATMDGQPLKFERVLAMCNLLFLAGLDTVTNAMGFMARHLAEHEDVQERLRHSPETIPAAIEEFLRRYAFVNTGRVLTTDMQFAGVHMKAGDMVIGSLTAASLDDRSTPNPEQLDLDRNRVAHVAFNTGPHICAGMWLARMELKIFLQEWLQRMPRFRLAPGFKPGSRPGIVMGLHSLELVWS